MTRSNQRFLRFPACDAPVGRPRCHSATRKSVRIAFRSSVTRRLRQRTARSGFQIVGPTYFQTLQLPIVAGRSFTSVDAAESALVCIVNEAFVRRYAAGRDPISLRVTTAAIVGNVAREIVGVARQVKGTADERQDLAQIYVPNAQVPYAEAFLLVSPTHGRTDVLANAVRAAIARVDREQPVRRVVTCAGRA